MGVTHAECPVGRLLEAIWGRQRLDEGLSEVLWHVTTIPAARGILGANELFGSAIGEGKHSEQGMKALIQLSDITGIPMERLGELKVVSFARSLTTEFIEWLSMFHDEEMHHIREVIVAFKMNGRALSNLGKGLPMDEFHEEPEYDEMEDRLILGRNKRISPLSRYVESVHVMLPPDNDEGDHRMTHLEVLEQRCEDLGISFYYHNAYPFNKHNVADKEKRLSEEDLVGKDREYGLFGDLTDLPYEKD